MRRNPLLQKEFRQRMRTFRTPWVISGYLAAMVSLTFLLLYENVQGQLYIFQPTRSEQVFFVMSLLQMTAVSFLTPAFAAGSISGERERKTLAVLLTTPLSPLGILVGKILSSSALLVLLLVVSLPLYSLVFLFGGAVPQEVLAVFAFQLYTIVLIATLSVFWSTIALRSGWSTVMSYATVAVMTLVTGIAGYGLRLLSVRYPLDGFAAHYANAFLSLNPLWVEATLENAVQSSSHSWWIPFVCVYSAVVLLMTGPAIWRLRPQLLHKVPGITRVNERNYQ